MKSTQRSPVGVERNAALNQLGIEPVSLELPFAPTARKEAAHVSFRFEMDFEDTAQFGLVKFHFLGTLETYCENLSEP